MTPQEKIDRIWCDVYARAFYDMARSKGFFGGHEPEFAAEEARRFADEAVADMRISLEPCTHCNGTGVVHTCNPNGERGYSDCSECSGTGRAT